LTKCSELGILCWQERSISLSLRSEWSIKASIAAPLWGGACLHKICVSSTCWSEPYLIVLIERRNKGTLTSGTSPLIILCSVELRLIATPLILRRLLERVGCLRPKLKLTCHGIGRPWSPRIAVTCVILSHLYIHPILILSCIPLIPRIVSIGRIILLAPRVCLLW